jgi:hypothetical protein
MEVLAYALGEIMIEAACADPAQAVRLDQLWRMLFSLQPMHTPGAQPAICFHLHADRTSMAPPPPGRPASQSGRLQGWRTATGYRFQCSGSALDVDLVAGRGTGVLTPGFWHCTLTEQREFFLHAFLMLLRRHGYYGLHANGVVKGPRGRPRGVLMAGESGSGKTTLALSLVRQGWCYLADDLLFLHAVDGQVSAVGLRRGFACLPETIERFPGLVNVAERSPRLMAGKKLLPVEAVSSGHFTPCCTPTVLLLPRVAGGRHSRLVPLDETGAVAALMGLSTGIWTDRTDVMQQLEMLKQLVQQARCYQLLSGEDVYTDPAAVSALLEQCQEGEQWPKS